MNSRQNLDEIEEMRRRNLEAGTLADAPGDSGFAEWNPADSVTIDARRAVDAAMVPHDGTTKGEDESLSVGRVHEAPSPAKKSQAETLLAWLKLQKADIDRAGEGREAAIAAAEQAGRDGDTGRGIVNAIAAGGSALAGNKDLAKVYLDKSGENRSASMAAQKRAQLAAWLEKQRAGLESEGKTYQQALEADQRDAYLRDALAAKPVPQAKPEDPLLDLKGDKLKAEIDKLKRPPMAKAPAAPKAASVKANAPPTSVLTTLADIDSARNIMSDLMSGRPEPEGLLSRGKAMLSGKVGQTKEGQFEARKRAAAQLIGGIMEGGKLTDSDFARYLNMMPGVGDTKEQAENKSTMLRQMLGAKADALKASFSGAGYKLPGAQPSGPVVMVDPKGETEEVEPELVQAFEREGWKRK